MEKLTVVLQDGTTKIDGKLRLDLDKAAVKLPDGAATLASAGGGLTVAAGLAADGAADWNVTGDIGAKGLAATSPRFGGAALGLAALDVRDLRANQALDIDASGFVLSGLTAKAEEGKAADVKLASLNVIGIEVRGGSAVTVKQVLLGALEAALSERLAELAGGGDEGEEETAPAGEPAQVAIGRVALAEPGKIKITDGSVEPAFVANVDLRKLEVTNLNTGDTSAKTQVAVDGTVNEFTKLKADGWVSPFGAKKSFDLTGGIEALELHPVSPYAAKMVGMNLESGRLSVAGKGAADAGKLDAKVDLDLLGLKFTPLTPEDQKRLSASVGMPVETVVGLLEDSEGRIKFAVPVKGDLENPDFDLNEVIGKAVGGAIVAAASGAGLAGRLGGRRQGRVQAGQLRAGRRRTGAQRADLHRQPGAPDEGAAEAGGANVRPRHGRRF